MTTNSLDTFTPDELLQAAVAKGATLQQALQQLVRTFAPEPTAAELAYVRAQALERVDKSLEVATAHGAPS